MLRILIIVLYTCISVIIIWMVYQKSIINISYVYALIQSNWVVLVVSIFLCFISFLLKVIRWYMLLGLSYSGLNFLYLLNLSATGSLLNSVGLSLLISDGIKSGVLVLSTMKDIGLANSNKWYLLFSPYLDRFIGFVAAIAIFSIFFLKNIILLVLGLLILGVCLIYTRNEYRVILLAFLLSLFSHIIESLSLYVFLKFVFSKGIDLVDWVLAYVVGSFSSLLSMFGGLGARAIGINLLLKDINLSFIVDIIHYLIQIICSIIGILVFFIYKFIYK
ncbi:MAG: hypothetical protein ABDH21_06080 [bacterium]